MQTQFKPPMTEAELVAWRAKRDAKRGQPVPFRPVATLSPLDGFVLTDGNEDPFELKVPTHDVLKTIDSAAALIAPHLTDGVLIALIERVLAAGRMELCGCLESMAADTVGHSAFERQFFVALRSFIQLRSFEKRAVVGTGLYPERCPSKPTKGGTK